MEVDLSRFKVVHGDKILNAVAVVNIIKERVLQVPFPEESVRDLISNQLMEEFRMGANA